MISRLLLLAGVLLALIPQFSVSSTIYTSYNYGPAYTVRDNSVKYQAQYVWVYTPRGYYLQLVLVPIANPTTTTTTTTTTTAPTTTRPPVSPSTFFSYAGYVPFQIYSSYICGLYNVRSVAYVPVRIGKRDLDLTSDSTRQRFEGLAVWLQSNKRNNDGGAGSPEPRSFHKRDQGPSRTGAPHLVTVVEIIQELRRQLLEGFLPGKLEELEMIFERDLTTEDLEYALEVIYAAKIQWAQSAGKSLQIFYVNDPDSSSSQLADSDLKRELIDLIAIANDRADCSDCELNFKNVDDVLDAMFSRLIPPGMTEEQKHNAKEGMKFLSSANLSTSDVSKLFQTFVDDVEASYAADSDRKLNNVNADDDQSDSTDNDDQSDSADNDDGGGEESDDESDEGVNKGAGYQPSLLSHYLQGGVGRKRSFYYMPTFDKQMVCFVLTSYIRGSSYCGVRQTASQIYTYLQCSSVVSPLQPATAATTSTTRQPSTTTTPATTTRTTTTTARPTTPKTTTTTRGRVAGTTTKATTTTSTTTTTTTTTTSTTTTPTTTTTTSTTAAPVQCGVSEIASRAASVVTSSFFVTPRIIGGRITGSCLTYSWMVRLSINNGQVCGGVIISETKILTAAHCVINKYKITATVGEYDTSVVEGTEQVFDVDTVDGVSYHPDFSFFTRSNDVAVLTLSKPIDFSQICAQPICLTPSYNVTNGQSCTVAGWGATAETSKTPSTTLKETSVKTFNGTDCATAFSSAPTGYFTDPDLQLCGGQPDVGGADACQGDSGGPLMCQDPTGSKYYVAGIVSYGDGCGRASEPGVYARVSAYIDWINQQL